MTEPVAAAESEPTPRLRRPRGPLMLLTVAVVLALAAWFALGAQKAQVPAVPGADPSAALDGAFSDGRPAYVLIHSLT